MRARTYLKLGRVSNLPTVFSNVVAGVVLAGGALDVRVLCPLIFACSCFYVGGMFLNDAFDREHDAREQPHRPIPSGEIQPLEVFALGFAMLGIGVGTVGLSASLAGRSAYGPLASGVGLSAAVVLYDVWHKNNPLSPVLMAACRVLVYVTSALAIAGALSRPLIVGAAALFAYLMGLTWAAKHEGKSALRAAPLVLLFVPMLATISLLRDPAGAALWLGFLAWTATQLSALLDRHASRAGAAIGGLIAGISLLDATLIAHAGRPFLAMFIAAAFAATLGLQRWVRGT